MNGRLGAFAALGLACLASVAGVLVAGSSSARAASECESGSLVLLGSTAAEPGAVPVVLVHGIDSDPSVWRERQQNGAASLADRLGDLGGTTVWGFDYGKASLRWVTDPSIGPALATAISCLARVTGERVIVVDHSMGGLAAQLAASQRDSGRPVAGKMAGVIAIGTPFEGSKLLSAVQRGITGGGAVSRRFSVLAEAVLSACAGFGDLARSHNRGNPCRIVAVPRSPVGRALMYRSSEIARLPAWPKGLPAKAIVGQMKVSVGVWKLRYTFGDAGDILVSSDSASARNNEGSPKRVVCEATNVQALSAPCYHGKLPTNPEVVESVAAAVAELIQRATSPPPPPRDRQPKPPPQPAPVPPAPTTTQAPATFDVGDPFEAECSVAWPTAPSRSATSIYMRLSCSRVPSDFLFVDVTYDDPSLPVTPSRSRMRVRGEVVDIVRSEYGFTVLVVRADRIELVG